MHKIENMIVFGGTHGNELTGVEVLKLLEKRNYFGKNLNLIGHFANRKAFELGKRFVDKDLNRSFTKEVLEKGGFLHEERVAKEIHDKYANPNNLITCTRSMNTKGMLQFENMVTKYIKDTGNHVLYRVTPVFEGNNLVATGVEMEAYSVEDNGKGIKFNVFVYNIEDGIIIDYKTGDSKLAS